MAGLLLRDGRLELFRRGDRRRSVSGHPRRDEQEVDVVRVIAARIDPLRLRRGEVGLVGRHGRLVQVQRFRIAPQPEENVRGHVDEMPRAKLLPSQALGMGFGPLRPV
ncbi:MAG: hypothetical protein M3453_06720 [Pseudomonadota bacterium]|nr:hypothetical protein [Pseudomonadota bacterium]